MQQRHVTDPPWGVADGLPPSGVPFAHRFEVNDRRWAPAATQDLGPETVEDARMASSKPPRKGKVLDKPAKASRKRFQKQDPMVLPKR
ncbi:MAG: hypothetical protein AMK72_13860 [Planctomycetes bacterium SM23_25]|nr:MAG: hypothetical protein AMK72_13860 [Planctomycetes bacterium SM23_25]